MYNICMIRGPRRRKREKGSNMYLRKLWMKTLKTWRNIYLGTGSTESPKQDEPKLKPTPRHIIIKMEKVKQKFLKAAREEPKNHIQVNLYKAINWFLCRNLQTKKWHVAFHVLRGKNLQLRMLYPARLSLRIGRRYKQLLRQAKIKRVNQY